MLLAGCLLAVAGCAGEPPEDVDASTPTSPAPSTSAFTFTFDQASFSDGRFTDASASARVGAAEAAGGEVVLVAGGDGGEAVRFPPPCVARQGCPRAMVVVPHADDLNPGTTDFTFGATVRLAPEETTTGSNIVQKGRFGTEGGQWKLQVDTADGRPSCVVRGDQQLVVVRSSVSIADDRWHQVSCTRDAAGVEIAVDGQVTREEGAVGVVSSEADVRIGSSGLAQEDDQFHGALDDVFLRIG